MTLYCWYQTEDKSTWDLALASERQNILRNKKPALITCLDADNDFTGTLTAEEVQSVKYSGDYYADFDSESIESAIEQFRKFLVILQSKDVDLNQVRLYATGGRGFHIHIPQAMFMPKVIPTGVAGLPHIYKEMSFAMYVDDLDLRIYTAKRGRQFRCANFKRSNGNYKVGITAGEAMSMTPEMYAQLCSAPRNDLPIDPPTFNAELGLLYSSARDKVDKAVTKRKAKKQAPNQLAKFRGEWPETALLIFSGAATKPDVGWNFISLQCAILASELGKSEEELLAAAEPLIAGHTGDSARYNTPYKRRDDLKTMFRYVNGSPLYEYSAGGLLALLIPEVRANADISFGDWQPDAPAAPRIEKRVEVQADGTEVEVEVVVEAVEEEEDNSPVKVSKGGIFVRSETGYTQASSIGIGKATALKRMDGQDVGYDVELFKNSKPLGYQTLTMDKLASRAAFQSFTFQWSASMSASDIQTAKIADILGRRAEKNNDVTFIVTREGVDLMVPHGSKSEDDFEIIWSSPEKVVGSKGGKYRLRSNLDRNGTFQSDLMNAPDLSTADAELIDNLLKMNTTQNLAKMLGWFGASFMTQIIRRFYKQFPSLQVFGQAGAGKSKSIGLLNHLGYYMKDPKQLQAQGTTIYPLLVAVASSASQAVVFEEVKSREMSKSLHDFLLNMFRCNYDGFSLARGTLTKDAAAKEVTVNNFENSGPIVFVGESVESQSALLERCIIVSLSKNDRYGKDHHYHYVADRRTQLGKLGKAMVTNVLALDMKAMRSDLDGIFAKVKASVGDKAEEFERPAFNISCVILGLKLLGDTLHQVFGDKFDERIEELKDSLTDNASDSIPANMSEAARILDVMAQLSRNPDVQYQIVKGVDYTMGSDGTTMDLKLRTAYSKYVKWQRSLGMEVLFDNENAFITGMSNYAGTLKRACPENMALFDSVKAVVYQLSLKHMDSEGVDSFKE